MIKINQIFCQNKEIDDGPLFIFELANNHMGDVEHGLKIIRGIHEACQPFVSQGWNFAFKFQYRDFDTFIHPDYKNRMDLKYIKRFAETRLSEEEFLVLKSEVDKLGFISICTPFDEKSVDKVVEHGFDIIKVASCSFTDWSLLEKIVQTDKPTIASTGGVKLEDIDRVVSFLQHRDKKFAIMHCVGQYPTLENQLQLNQIDFLKKRYPDVIVGFSTHESPDNFDAIKLAIAKGAEIFEKHVGLKTDKYSLNSYSAAPEQARAWLDAARKAYDGCGVADKRHESATQELADIRQFQRGTFALRDIKAGEKIEMKDVFFAFPNQEGQVVANEMSKYLFYSALRDYKANEPIMSDGVNKIDVRGQVYLAVERVNKFLRQANIPMSNKWDFELSHHYGLDKFYEYGASLVTCLNREYCKKLIVVLPGQKHPSHSHKLKEETFHVLWGDVVFITSGERKECGPGDIITMERESNHSFESKDGCVLEEISTTHYKDDTFYEDASIMQNPNRKTQLTYWVIQ